MFELRIRNGYQSRTQILVKFIKHSLLQTNKMFVHLL